MPDGVREPAGNALEKPDNAALFEAYFKANLSLQKAAARPTQTGSLLTAKAAANLLGKQIDLVPTAADFLRYGVDDATLGARLADSGLVLQRWLHRERGWFIARPA